jgi:5'-nucleotidase
MKTKSIALLAGVLLPLASAPASALDILLTNDDGFETEYIQTLHQALIDAGHRVVMSAPYLGQSGSGGKANFLVPIGPTEEDSEGGGVPAGSPGVGPNPDPMAPPTQFYVNGSPVDSVMYGIDIAAPMVFGGPAELVISGPNEGNNLGVITPHSGTLGAAVAALNKGYPTIAVSADSPDGTPEEAELIAQLTLKVVEAVDGKKGINLEPGTGLSVNIPDTDVDPALSVLDDFEFKLTRIGGAANIGLQFYERLGDSPIANLFGIPPGFPLPGLSVEVPYTAAGYPVDDSDMSEGNVLDDLVVTVSPIQGTYQADDKTEKKVKKDLKDLFKPKKDKK